MTSAKRSIRSRIFEPIRRLLEPIGRRIYYRQFDAIAEIPALRAEIEALRSMLASVESKIPSESRFEPLDYLQREHLALTRRHAAIEDRLERLGGDARLQ